MLKLVNMFSLFFLAAITTGVLCGPQNKPGYNEYSRNSIEPNSVPNDRLVSSALTDHIWQYLDPATLDGYTLTLRTLIHELANQPDEYSQAQALAQTIATVAELASGSPGDTCAYAELINAYEDFLKTGNTKDLTVGLEAFVRHFLFAIDTVALAHIKPSALKLSVDPVGSCKDGGRIYQFEAGWSSIKDMSAFVTWLERAKSTTANTITPERIYIIKEEYDTAKCLYAAYDDVRSNNVAAAVTATSIQPVVILMEAVLPQTANFLKTLKVYGNVPEAAAKLKTAIIKELPEVQKQYV